MAGMLCVLWCEIYGWVILVDAFVYKAVLSSTPGFDRDGHELPVDASQDVNRPRYRHRHTCFVVMKGGDGLLYG